MKDRHTNRKAHNKTDLTNQIIGKLKVICDTGIRKSNRPIWKCLCECGTECNILSKYLLNGDTQSCGCIIKNSPSHNRGGYKTITLSYFNHCKRNAEKRGIPWEITPEILFNLIENQNYKCALSGVDIYYATNMRDERELHTASLDRIDSTKGYTIDNVQWVHKVINIMKNTLSNTDFIDWCKKIVLENNKYKVEPDGVEPSLPR